jgi:GntR family transcriptional regulator/MocR family aminotransferase
VARQALAGYVARARGVHTDPAHVVVCSGFTQALALLVEALADAGAAAVALEDPCISNYRAAVRHGGLQVHSLRVDEQGADPRSLDAARGVGAAVLTPAHQYPTGTTLSAPRRAAFRAWAQQTGSWLVEDDYDGEFRYDRQPVGALQAMDPDRVAYVGTASKSLAPGLRLAWMALPPGLVAPVVAAKELADRHTSALDQLTLAELIRSGALDRHVRRSRLRYRRRRDELVAALGSVPSVRLRGIAAGLHAVLELPADGRREAEVVDRLDAAGVAVHGLAEYWHEAPGPVEGIVIGFGTPPEHAFNASVETLVAQLR